MSKRDKLIQRIFKGKSDITPEDAIKILENLGYVASRTSGSHLTFRKQGRSSVTIVLTQNSIKSYLLEKLQETLRKEGYRDE